MIFYSRKAAKKNIEKMIIDREHFDAYYSEALGFEGSDEALILAQLYVYKAMVALDIPKWAFEGDKQFRKYLNKFGQKTPNYDFDFVINYTREFWDSFRFTLMHPQYSGGFSNEAQADLRNRFVELYSGMPTKFRVKSGEEQLAVELMICALSICLKEERQFVANPIFEYVLLVWYHFTWNSR